MTLTGKSLDDDSSHRLLDRKQGEINSQVLSC